MSVILFASPFFVRLPFFPSGGWTLPSPPILQPLRLRNFRLHLHNEDLELLLALLAGAGVDIA